MSTFQRFRQSHWFKFTGKAVLIAGLAFMIGFFQAYHLPQIKSWILVEVEKQSQQHSPFRIWPQEVEINFIPPGLTFKNIRVLPQNDLAKALAPSHIAEASVSLSLFALMKGEIRASEIIFEKPDIKLILKDNPFKRSEGEIRKAKTFQWSFEDIYQIPVDEIRIENLSLMAKIESQDVAFRMLDAHLSLENRYRSILAELDFPQLQLKQLGNKPDLKLQVESRFLAEKNQLQISALKVKKGQSYAVASGKVLGDIEKGKFDQILINTRSFVDLEEVKNWLDAIAPDIIAPGLLGSIGIDIQSEIDPKTKTAQSRYTLEGKEIFIDDREIGDVQSKGSFNPLQMNAEFVRVQNSYANGEVKDFELKRNDSTVSFKGTAQMNRLQLQKFLKAIRVGDIPVQANFNGTLPCSGELQPQLKIACNGKVDGTDLHIYTDSEEKKDRKTIVKLKEFGANGNVHITNKEVSYNAQLAAGKRSKGTSSGKISYQQGFDISYTGQLVDFADIEDLAGLKLEGEASLSGKTNGTSKWGVVQMDAQAKDVWLEDYGLGSFDANLRYKSGVLTFRKVKGQFLTTRYNGHLNIDLPKERIFINGEIPYVDLSDVKQIFSRRVQLPIEINGTGTGSVKAWGPLKFSKMSYEMDSSFFRGKVANETFDQAKFSVISKNGHVKTKSVNLTKAQSRIDLEGKVNPEGLIDAVLVGRKLRLEQSENINRLGLDLIGQFDFTMSMKGQLPNPKMELHGRLKDMVIGDQPAEPSNFKLKFLQDRLEGGGQFIGDTVQSEFVFPYNETAPFRFFLRTKKWDFTQIFSLLSVTAKKKDFSTTVTSQIDLAAAKGGFWQSSGRVEISELQINRGPLSIAAPSPIAIDFTDGIINSDNFFIEGDGTSFRWDIKDASKNNISSELNGKVSLSLMSLLTPFLEDLRGSLSMSVRTQGSLTKPEIMGSAFIESGYVKLDGFPHAFDDINADLLFNQKNILINAYKAVLGGGILKGDGKVTVNSLTDVPIDIKGHFENVALNIPNGMRTKGQGFVALVGNNFPYTLKGNYDVNYGDITMDFTESHASGNEIKPSSFLPRFLTKESFQPIRLDLSIDLKRAVSVKNSLVDAQVKGKIHVNGIPDSLILDGALSPLPGGKVIFKDTIFEISTGYVDYKHTSPENPIIYLAATSKVQETTINEVQKEQTTNYDINLLVQGPAKNLSINLESQPPLSEQEIVSLLALGVTSTSRSDSFTSTESQEDTGIASGVIGTQIGASLLGRQLSEPLKERLGVDVKISTSINTDDNASYPKVIFSKQWTPKWETSASRTIENSPKSDVKVEYKVSDNLSLIGLWEGREETEIDEDKENEPNRFGLDLEYKFKFK